MQKYRLTPKGLMVLAAMNGITKLSVETNTTPLTLEFYGEEVRGKSEPELRYEVMDKVMAFLSWHGLVKRV